MKRFAALILTCLLLAALPVTAFATDSEVPIEVSYNFVLENSEYVIGEKKPFNGGYLTGADEQNAISAYYEAGTLNWKYAVDSSNFIRTSKNSVRNVHYFGSEGERKWEGLRLGLVVNTDAKKEYADNHWVAFTCKIPAPGYYKMTLQYMTRADGFSDAQIYVLPGAYTDEYRIETSITQDALVGGVDYSSDTFDIVPAEKEIGEIYAEDTEFTLVFHTGLKEAPQQMYQYLRGFTLSNADIKAAAQETQALIAEIDGNKPSVKAVKDAEQAYEQLTPGQQFYVANYEKLQAAKIQLERMQNKTLVAGIVAGVAVVAGGAIAAVVLRKKKNIKQSNSRQ